MGAITVAVQPLTESLSREWLSSRIGGRGLAEPGALSELAGLCDGNLLLLRRVADHVRSTPGARLAEFVDELHDDGALLDLGSDDDDPDGSIGAAFSWSYLALDEDTKRAFRLLGNHPGPDVSVAAAAALIGVERLSAARQLDGLVKENMLAQPEQRTRYRQGNLLRKYAIRCGASEHWRDERQDAQQRILSFYHRGSHDADRISFPNRESGALEPLVAGVTPPEFPDATAAREWLIQERRNLTAAIGFARAHGYHKYVTAMSSSTGETFLRLGYYEDVVFGLRAAIASAEAISDIEMLADSLGNLGFVFLRLRNHVAAEDYFRRSKEIYDRVGWPLGSATSLDRMGRLYVERGEYRRGIEAQQAALRALRAIDSPEARGHEIVVLYRLGEAFRRMGDLDAAVRHANQGLWLAETSSDVRGSAYCHAELAATCYELQDLQLAHSHSVKSSELSVDLEDYELAAKNWGLLGLISRDQGDIRRAEYYLRAAAAAARELRDLLSEAEMYHVLGQLLRENGDAEKAIEWLTKAMAIFERLNDSRAEDIRRLLLD
jgi:tetratricopeptide (TPR) repeat protein